jgi:HlyD family secretion protein
VRMLFYVLATALMAGAGGFFVRGLVPSSFQKKPVPSPDTSRTKVASLGRLEPSSQVIAVGLPAGSRVQRLTVHEGEWVPKDHILAYLDSYNEMAAACEIARVQLEEAKKRLTAETEFGNATVEAAQLRIRQTEEVAPLAIQSQEAEVRRAQAELEKAKLDLDRSQQMLNQNLVSRSRHDSDSLIVRRAEEALTAARSTLSQLKLDREIKLRLGRSDLKSAEANSLRAQLATQVDSLAAALKHAEARLDRAVIHAPVEGKVIKILTLAGEAVGKEPLLKMGDTRSMFVVAEVYETDVRLVHKGQRATVTSKAFPDVELQGTVEQVGSLVHKNDVLAVDPTADADARIVEVRIRLDDSALACHYNYLQVDVTIGVSP